MSRRSYEDAIGHLNTLQSNASAIQGATIRSDEDRAAKRASKLSLVIEYLGRMGYAPSDLNKLNVIHVTGTKGKGSTCAMVDSILRCAKPEWSIGLYTSPHLVAVRERIRINGAPISEELFAQYFFEVWDRLGENDTRSDPNTPLRPMYFRFLTIMAWHVFLSLQVNVAVVEVGIGGLHDDTNIIPKPIVTGVSSIGYDHMAILGQTLGEIAFQKGGIFKEGVTAWSVEQLGEVTNALRTQAVDRKAAVLKTVLIPPELNSLPRGLAGDHQIQNAALAIELARTAIQTLSPSNEYANPGIPSIFAQGIASVRWPGRCQKVADPMQNQLLWHFDGAHTAESLECSLKWFTASIIESSLGGQARSRILLFNCTKGRTGHSFLQVILSTVQAQLSALNHQIASSTFFDHVIFCTNITYSDGGFKGDLLSVNLDPTAPNKLEVQKELAHSWRTLLPDYSPMNVHVIPSIQDAVSLVRSLAENAAVDILVTGSLHLVGGVIEVASLTDAAL